MYIYIYSFTPLAVKGVNLTWTLHPSKLRYPVPIILNMFILWVTRCVNYL